MDRTLAGKVAFVTGSGRGLGRAIAARLAERGADIAIHDISAEAPAKYGEFEDIEASALELDRCGIRTMSVIGNLAHEGEALAMEVQIRERLGPVSILVNCAGGDIGAKGSKPDPNDALHVSLEDMRTIIDNNFVSTMLTCQAFCRGMVERGEGAVINIASGAAHFGTSPEVTYSSMKAAVVHFTRCLAYELRPTGVRVNAVSPGPTKTARFLVTRKLDPAMLEAGKSLQRYAEPDEIADAVAFLASDEARFIHGQVLRVDGGLTLYAG